MVKSGKWSVAINNNATDEPYERLAWTLYHDGLEVITSKEFKTFDLVKEDARQKLSKLAVQLHGLTEKI